MTGPNLNTAVPLTALLTGQPSFLNSAPIAQIILPQMPVKREITRIILTTTLTQADMAGTQYWDGVSTQAPFYCFIGTTAFSNLQHATLIGNFNVGTFFTPLVVPAQMDFVAYWLGVNSASAGKCQATLHQRAA